MVVDISYFVPQHFRVTCVWLMAAHCMAPCGLKKGFVFPRRRARVAVAVRAGWRSGEVSLTGTSATATLLETLF